MPIKLNQIFISELDLPKRLSFLNKKFQKLYGGKPDLYVRSPGRAEIIGNHTDYNHGFALSCCISRSFLALFRKRKDRKISLYSQNFSRQPHTFLLDHAPAKSVKTPWANYALGVADQFVKQGYRLSGADIFLESTIPVGAGVSSSAAYEMAIAVGLSRLSEIKIRQMNMALLCQKAENNFVGSPCGFLDQGTITFGEADKLVFMDFLPKNTNPVSKISTFKMDLNNLGVEFVIFVDRETKHDLGASGYPLRRKMCYDSLDFWREKLKRKITSLRTVGVKDFEKYKNELDKIDPVMRKRVEHVVYENQRVLQAIRVLKTNDIKGFGELMTASGESALRLYELDEKTPELTFLYREGKKLPGVLGIRNMGGGFSATVLALVKKEKLTRFCNALVSAYRKKFRKELISMRFNITSGAGKLSLP